MIPEGGNYMHIETLVDGDGRSHVLCGRTFESEVERFRKMRPMELVDLCWLCRHRWMRGG